MEVNERKRYLVNQYAAAWNSLDAKVLSDVFEENVEYHSQTVLDVKVGKQAVMNYLESLFGAIRSNNMPVLAEVANYKGIPCVVLTQFYKKDASGSKNVELTQKAEDLSGFEYQYRDSVVLFSFGDGKILRINLCVVPTVQEVVKDENKHLKSKIISRLKRQNEM